MYLCIDDVRKNHANLASSSERLPVIVRTTNSILNFSNLGVQFWTMDMIKSGAKQNSDHSFSVFLEIL